MPQRPKLPFRVSPRVIEHIRRYSHAKPALQATMMFVVGFAESDLDGNVTARFEGKHLLVGYHKPRQVSKWPRFEIGGHCLAICPNTLARLQGKRLALRK